MEGGGGAVGGGGGRENLRDMTRETQLKGDIDEFDGVL